MNPQHAMRPGGPAMRLAHGPLGGVSWQVVPYVLTELQQQPEAGKAQRVTQALLQMKKLDIDALTRAAR